MYTAAFGKLDIDIGAGFIADDAFCIMVREHTFICH
jgi:hypothetical protein